MGENVLKFLDKRIVSFYKEAKDLKSGKMCSPRFGIIYPTYRCNHDCVGCDYSEFNNCIEPREMSNSEMDHVISQFKIFNIRAIEFCGGGEPLLHPHIDKSIENISNLKMGIGILTNGTRLDSKRIQLILRHCSYVRVSVEAGTKNIFDKIKRPKDEHSGFDEVISNIDKLVHYKNKLRSKCQVSYKFTVDTMNTNDIVNAVKLAVELGVDSIQFKARRNCETELSQEKKNELEKIIIELRKEYKSIFILGTLLQSPISVKCWLSPIHTVVDPYGDVYICCYYGHRKNDHKIGNIFERQLSEIWYCKEHALKIDKINSEKCEKYDCRFIKYNKLMDDCIDGGQLDFI